MLTHLEENAESFSRLAGNGIGAASPQKSSIDHEGNVVVAVADVTVDRRVEPVSIKSVPDPVDRIRHLRERHAHVGGHQPLCGCGRHDREGDVVACFPEAVAGLGLHLVVERGAALRRGDLLRKGEIGVDARSGAAELDEEARGDER